MNANSGGAGNNETITMVTKILDRVFMIIICITMFLCFFALSSNMTANLLDQRKEIAVLRATGMTNCRLKLLYFYEALIMVLAACILGILIGIVVGYTMVL